MTNRQQNQTVGEAMPANDDRDRPALPPGHPIAWRVLTEGTILEGTMYPLPVFL